MKKCEAAFEDIYIYSNLQILKPIEEGEKVGKDDELGVRRCYAQSSDQ